jgi:catechol 2,3-dioxygenase-like lactoylglutathione lyase family enzyme
MLSLDHVVFPVWDADASLRFYNETLGLPLIGAFGATTGAARNG